MNPARTMFGISAVIFVMFALVFWGRGSENLGDTPEQALRTCAQAVSSGDMRTFSEYTVDGDEFWKEWNKASKEERDMARSMLPMLIGDISYCGFTVTDEKVEGDDATLWVMPEFHAKDAVPVRYYMRKEGDRWKFDPGQSPN